MTLPDERYRAMKCGYQFLLELLDPKKTPKVPRHIRKQASSILRHYPGPYYLEMIPEVLPDHFQKSNSFLTLIVNNKEESNDDEFSPPPSVA